MDLWFECRPGIAINVPFSIIPTTRSNIKTSQSCAQIPHVNLSELWTTNASAVTQREHKVFCLTLRVIPEFPSWVGSTLFVKCQTQSLGSGTSSWYRLATNWLFVSSEINPKNSWDDKYSRYEAVSTTQQPATSTSYFSSVNPTIRQSSFDISPVNHQPSVPLPIVIASAGGAAAFVVLLLILVIVLLRKVKQQRKEIEMTQEEIDEFMLGVAAEKANAKGINGLFILPYDTRLEIPKADVAFRELFLNN